LLPDALAGEHPKKAMTTMEHCHVRFSYNPSFSAYFFSAETVFFSHNKSTGTVFQLVFQRSERSQSLMIDYKEHSKESKTIYYYSL